MEENQTGERGAARAVPAVTQEQIETLNLNRVLILCGTGLAFELLNLLNPTFWTLPILWAGAAYVTALSLTFGTLILWGRRHSGSGHYKRINNTFWVLLIIGFLPFLINDAAVGDKPLNCTLLGIALICGPLLETNDLTLVFAASLAVNLLAPLLANHAFSEYYAEVAAITTGTYLLARNLHGRYFRLLEDQKQQYNALLQAQQAQQELSLRLAKERDANAAKTRFLSLMSHDLRTPLGAVIGLSELAADDALPRQKVQGYLGEINHAGHYLLDIINEVLDMSRIESQKMELHETPYSLDEYCASIRSVVELLCAQKQLQFEIVRRGDLPAYILADKTRFNQIFFNLLTNAVKYTPAGGRIALEIEAVARRENATAVRFTVRDTGIGMSKEFIRHAFEPFVQEREDDGNSGVGLGLSIVQNLVSLMGGTVHIDSEPGRGTAVQVDMTLAHAPAPAAPQPGVKDTAGALRGKRILLCEDNTINAQIVMALLESVGACADHAQNGRQGLAMFEASQPGAYAAVLMDIRMPEMSGIDAARALRALDRPDAARVPIIALTANAYEEDRRRCLDAGMDDHVSKPIDTEVFLRTLCSHIARAAPGEVGEP